jgi:predicted MFS family arabinose efflux permease
MADPSRLPSMTQTNSPTANPMRGDRDFLKLWLAQGVSAFGARITREGLPIAAVLTLGAAPAQIGLLAALTRGPALIVGLAAGGLVDRTRKRGLLIAMDLARAGVLATIPLAAWLHLLTMTQIYLAAAAVGAASVLFEIADHAYLPGLVARDAITAANASLSATESVAEVAGPALAGVLFQWFAGPFAIAFNALTYLISAAFLGGIGKREPQPEVHEQSHWRRDIADGVRAAVGEPRVASLLFLTGSNALFGSFFSALYIFFALRVLGLTTTLLGLTVAAGGVGALVGAFLAPRLARGMGTGPAIVATAIGAALVNLLIPLAPARPGWGMAFLVTAQFFGDALGVTTWILAVSLRQTLLPQGVLGRVAATFQAVAGGLGILGALTGGMLGGMIGARGGLLIGLCGMLVGAVVVALSPLRRYREAVTIE